MPSVTINGKTVEVPEGTALDLDRLFGRTAPRHLEIGFGMGDTLALLYQRAATAALVEGRREVAVERHLRARELVLEGRDPVRDVAVEARVAEAPEAHVAQLVVDARALAQPRQVNA